MVLAAGAGVPDFPGMDLVEGRADAGNPAPTGAAGAERNSFTSNPHRDGRGSGADDQPAIPAKIGPNRDQHPTA